MNCPFINAVKEDWVLGKFRRFWKLELDGTKLIQIVVCTISVIAFLEGIRYFSAKPSLQIKVHPTPYGYFMDTVRSFYQKNKFEIPEIFFNEPTLKKIFFHERRNGGIDLLIPEILKFLQEDINMKIPKQLTEDLEKRIKDYEYERGIWFSSAGEYIEEEKFKGVLQFLKSKLSEQEYFVFISALIYSREIDHNIFINNDGDVDLKELTFIIPSPWGKIEESRDNNILNFQFISSKELHIADEKPDRLMLSIPELKRKRGFSIKVRTRENQIDQNDILNTYKADYQIQEWKVFQHTIFVFIVIFLLCVFLTKGDTKP